MAIEFDITLSAKDLYRFHMYQVYTGSNGWFSILCAVVAVVMTIVTYGRVEPTYTLLYAAFGIAFLLYLPVTLYVRSKKNLENSKDLSKPLHYLISEEGITVSRKKESAKLSWAQIYKMVATKNNVLIYSNRNGAYVIPKAQLGEHYQPLAELAATKLPKNRLKMKGIT